MIAYAAARRMMVNSQIRTSDVTDQRLLDAFAAISREHFVPTEQADLAYLDRDMPLGPEGRALLKPMVLARLLQAAGIMESDRVLDVGCATGYTAAIAAQLGREVVGLEEDEELAAHAERNFRALGIANARVQHGALTEGAAGSGPFDVIVIAGCVERLPDAFSLQMQTGGRLVCVMRDEGARRAWLHVRATDGLNGRPLFDATAPLLPGFGRSDVFVF